MGYNSKYMQNSRNVNNKMTVIKYNMNTFMNIFVGLPNTSIVLKPNNSL